MDHQLQVRSDNIEQFITSGRGQETDSEDQANEQTEPPGQITSAPQLLPPSVGVAPTDELYQISSASGSVLYKSTAMRELRVPLQTNRLRDHYRHHRDRGNFTTYYHKGGDVRVLSSAVRADGNEYTVQVAMVVSPLYEVLDTFRGWALTALPLIASLAGLVGYWLSGRVMEPVHHLVLATREISERNLSKRLQLPAAQDELHELASTVNAMLDRLESAFTRIVQFTSTLRTNCAHRSPSSAPHPK